VWVNATGHHDAAARVDDARTLVTIKRTAVSQQHNAPFADTNVDSLHAVRCDHAIAFYD
jgi:hypothetical protein